MLQVFSFILNGLFIKVNINVIDFSLLKGLISGLLQSILESPRGIPMWNPYVESLFKIPPWKRDYGKFFRLKVTKVIPEWKNSSIILKVLCTWNQQILFINDWTLLLRSNQNYNARGSKALGHLWIQDLRTYTCNST